jgi:hypothetical protein
VQRRSDERGSTVTVEMLARLLGDDARAWADAASCEAGVFCATADAHGIVPLLAERAGDAPPAIRDVLRSRTRTIAAGDAIAEASLREAIDALHGAGVDALLIKGADLAYSVYDRPHLRPRLDSDILIAPPARQRACDVLRRLGFDEVAQSGGDLLMYQQAFARHTGGAVAHAIDLHWRIANPQRFGSAFDFDELWAASGPRPSLTAAARGLSTMHALALACVHRIAHHYDEERLIWTYDIHALASRMTPADWEALAAYARARKVAAACVRGLDLARDVLGTSVPGTARRSLEEAARHEPASARYLRGGQRHIQRIWSDFSLLPSWAARARLARQHLFPPPRYMHDVYAPGSRAPLAVLYARRAWSGARRWMARS